MEIVWIMFHIEWVGVSFDHSELFSCSCKLVGSRVSELLVLTGEVLRSYSGAPEVTMGISEIVIALGEMLCSCSGAWYHVGAFIPL